MPPRPSRRSGIMFHAAGAVPCRISVETIIVDHRSHGPNHFHLAGQRADGSLRPLERFHTSGGAEAHKRLSFATATAWFSSGIERRHVVRRERDSPS